MDWLADHGVPLRHEVLAGSWRGAPLPSFKRVRSSPSPLFLLIVHVQAIELAGGWTPYLRRLFLLDVRDRVVFNPDLLEYFIKHTSRDEALATGLVKPDDQWPPTDASLDAVSKLIARNAPRGR